MEIRLNPYLGFRNNTKEAMLFYQSIFGGKLDINTFKEYNASEDPNEDDKVMHSMLEAPNGIAFMASDTPNELDYQPGINAYSMSLSGDNVEVLTEYFEKLSAGGVVLEPLEKAPWGDTFGMLNDKFGVQWLVNIAEKK